MTDRVTCPKRERMSRIRADRQRAGFCEVTVWVPHELSRALRDLAWRIIDGSPIEFPHRGPRRSVDHDAVDASDLLDFVRNHGPADGGRNDGEQPT